MTSSIALIHASPSPIRLRRSLAALLALGLLSFSAPLVQAGTAELSLLNAYLTTNFGTTVPAATSAQLAQAVRAVIQANPTKNGGTIAGEALKGAGGNAPDAGAQIATAVITAFPGGTIPFGTKPLTYQAFAAQAIKTTASGTGLTVTQVPGFTAPFVANDSDAIALAILVKGSKRAAGAVISGRAGELGSDLEKQTLANLALANAGLSAVVQDVAAGVAATVANPVAFTTAVLTAPANLKNVLKIVPGIATGKPADAGAILEASFVAFAAQGIASPIVKGAATLAKSVGAVADIEQVQRVGLAIATRISTGVIKLSQLNHHRFHPGQGDREQAARSDGANRNANKVDELGELAAYMLNAVIANADFLKAPDKATLAFIKAIITGAKSTFGPSALDVTSYVVGSIALTVRGLPAGPVKTALTALLQNPATVKSLGGTALAGIVADAINSGLAGTGVFENGTDAAAGAITDPETNSRNL